MNHQYPHIFEGKKQITMDQRIVEDSNFTPRHLPLVGIKVFLISFPNVTFIHQV